MNDYLLFKICFLSACFGWCYVEKLTGNRQIFDFMQAVHEKAPEKLRYMLGCSYCLSGWVAMICTAIHWRYFESPVIYTIIAAPLSMFFVGVVLYFNGYITQKYYN